MGCRRQLSLVHPIFECAVVRKESAGGGLDSPAKPLLPRDPLKWCRKNFASFVSHINKCMGKPTTLLEGLCGHAVSLGARSIQVEHKDSREWVFADRAGMGIGIANYKSSSADGKELRGNLYAAAKKPVRSVIGGQVYILKVTVFESFGEDAFAVSIELAPKLDPSIAPSFTAKQGSISGLRLQLHEDPWPASRGIGPGALFQGFPRPRFTR